MRVAKIGRIGGGFTASCLVAAAIFAGMTTHADTYYAMASTKEGLFPNTNCVWYVDEACTTKTSISGLSAGQVQPAANDGNTYVILSAYRFKQPYVAPAGTRFVFRFADSEKMMYYASGTTSWGSATVSNITAQVTSAIITQWEGEYTFIEDGKWTFMTDSGLQNGTQGHVLAGTFISPESARITLKTGWKNALYDTPAAVQLHRLTGDFTGFRGKILTDKLSDKHYHNTLSFESASAFGASDVECTDYVTLKTGNWLRLAPAVTQYSTKGITLSLTSAETAAIEVEHGNLVTLTAPLYGANGTLEKHGDGALTLSAPVAVTNIRVAEGTLGFGSGATFAAGTQITVAKGASISYVTPPQNVTIVMEDGALRVQPTLAVPFDGTATTPVALASGYSPENGVTPVLLSQAIELPLNASNRWAVATIPNGTLTAANFRDDSPKTYNLPKTWFEVETDPSTGLQTVYLAARPAVKYYYKKDEAGSSSMGAASSYSDGCAPSNGKDYYYMNSGGQYISGGTTHSKYTFLGETMSVISSTVSNYDYTQTIARVTLFNGGAIAQKWAGSGSTMPSAEARTCHVLLGNLTVDRAATGASPASIVSSEDASLSLDMNIDGCGYLKVSSKIKRTESGPAGTNKYVSIGGNNSGFTGRMLLAGVAGTAAAPAPMRVSFTNATAFGGAPAEFDKFAIQFSPMAVAATNFFIEAAESVVLDTANRGWSGTAITLCAAEGKHFVFAPPYFCLTSASSELRVAGPGVVGLGYAPTWGNSGAVKKLRVDSGSVKAVDGTSYAGMSVEFASAAGIALDETPASDGAAAYGLRAGEITAEGTIPVQPIPADGVRIRRKGQVEWAVCTVPETNADLSNVLQPQPVRGLVFVGMEKVTLAGADAGYVSYRVKYSTPGTAISFR